MFWLVLVLALGSAWPQDPTALVKKHFDQGLAFLEASQPQNAEREFRRVIELDPGNAPAYNLLGSIYDFLGDHARADASFLEAIRLSPSSPAPYNNLGISYLRQNRGEEALKTFNRALVIDPRNVTAHYNLGLLFMKSGDLGKSVAHLEQARSLRPQDPSILFNLARAYFQMGSYASAVLTLKELDRLPVSSRLAEVQNLFGTVLTRVGQLDEAIARLRRAAGLDPAGSDPHYKLALVWQKKGNLDEALKEIQEAIRLQKPPVAEHYLALGMIHRERNETERADRAFKRAFEIAPDAQSTRFALAVLLRDAGRYPEAVREFERVRSLGRSYDLDVNLAMTYYLSGDFPRALNLLEEISAASPGSKPASFYKLLAEVYAKLERWSDALGTLEKAIELDPRNPILYFDLGLVFVNLNALRQAEELFLGVLKHIPEAPELYVGLAQARMFQDHYLEALEALERAIALDPNYAEAHYLMGNCWNELNRYAEARRAYEKAISLAPERDDFHFSFASALETTGEEEAAWREFEKVVSLNPNSADGHYRLGRLLSGRGDTSRAEAHLRKAIELKAKDPQAYFQLAGLYLKTGRREDAQRALETGEKLKKVSSADRSTLASMSLKPVEQYLHFLSP